MSNAQFSKGSVVIDTLFIIAPIVHWGSVFGLCFMQYLESFLVLPIIVMEKRELVALLKLFPWCLVTLSVLWIFLTVLWFAPQCVIVAFPDHTHLLFAQVL